VGGCRFAASTERNLKNTDFVFTVALKLLLDLRFSLNQPLKSTFDWYIGILKDVIKTSVK
jgi:hypothetical protein